MVTISHCFQSLRDRQQCALIPFITAGDPDLTTTAEALRILDRNGADFIELGVPYSDPLADGPVIQAAATRALQTGIKLEQVLEMLRDVSPKLKAPLILFTYYNPTTSCIVVCKNYRSTIDVNSEVLIQSGDLLTITIDRDIICTRVSCGIYNVYFVSHYWRCRKINLYRI